MRPSNQRTNQQDSKIWWNFVDHRLIKRWNYIISSHFTGKLCTKLAMKKEQLFTAHIAYFLPIFFRPGPLNYRHLYWSKHAYMVPQLLKRFHPSPNPQLLINFIPTITKNPPENIRKPAQCQAKPNSSSQLKVD